MLRQFFILLIICTLGVIGVEAKTMSLFKGEEVCVASGFEGRVLFKGKPAAGARIVRKFNWKNEKGQKEETIADEEGKFSFPSHFDILRRVIPAQFVAYQDIFAFYQGKEYRIWRTGKLDKSEFSEFGGKPTNFRCELTEALRRVDLDRGFVGTNCYWD